MGDLRANGVRMSELLDHLWERESAVPHFYCDHVGLVTIAVGFLVDQRGGSTAVGTRLARQLLTQRNVTFTDSKGVAATPDEVALDWERVKQYGQLHLGAGGNDFARVAQLRINRQAIRTLTETTVNGFLNTLYLKRPFILHYDERVAMALVDVRYNPGGVPLYDKTSQTQPMWDALNPSCPSYDLNKAMVLFETIWANLRRVTNRYGIRHYQRVKWMRAGLLASGGAEAPQSV